MHYHEQTCEMNSIRGDYRYRMREDSQAEPDSDDEEEQYYHLNTSTKGNDHSMIVWLSQKEEKEGTTFKYCEVNQDGIV